MKPLNAAIVGLIFVMAGKGLGHHIWELSSDQVMHLSDTTFIAEILFALSVSFSKVAALVYYGKLFRAESYVNKAWRWAYYAVFAMAVAWPFATIATDVFVRESRKDVLLSPSSGSLSSLFATYIWNAVASVIIDIAILVLPLPPIYTLHLGAGRRLALAGIFVLGYS